MPLILITTKDEFTRAAEDVKKLNSKPTNEELLTLYSLYKQATVGDCNVEKPGMFDLKGKYKWQKWNDLKGMSTEEAQKSYIEHVKALQAQYA